MTPEQAKKMKQEIGLENFQVPPDQVLSPVKFQLFEFHNNCFSAIAAPGTKPEILRNPTFWAHIADQLKQFDRIEVKCEDATWWADVIVLSVSKGAAKVEILNQVVFGQKVELKTASMDPANYKAEFLTGDKWRVLRTLDNEVMVKGLDTEQLAQDWIETNIGKAKKKAA